MEEKELENHISIGSLNTNPPIHVEDVEPYIGMEFLSHEDSLNYYTRYAKKYGFSFRMNRVTRSRTTGVIIGQEFVCSKEGFRNKKYAQREDRVNEPPDETRIGCKAVLKVSQRNDDKWIVSRFVKEHNHDLASPKSSKFLRVHKKKTKVQKRLIDVLDNSGIPPSKIMAVLSNESGGIDNVQFTERDVMNYLGGKRQKELGRGDAQVMLTYFRDCQSKNPGFFYAVQMDADGQLANCFWADARSRMAYQSFGDVVTFDPTYLTNKYKMPFVPFTGVNHHHQSILFGCGLLWDETEASFVWLLTTWLEAMFGCPPKTIITDQDAAITKAVEKVLPNVAHHYCKHIEKKVPEYLSHIYHDHEEFKNKFFQCIHQTITPQEFEDSWHKIMQTYGLQDNHWLTRIYSIREKWIPAYVRSSFCAGMSTTQRSESMNKFFKDFVHSSTPVSKFVVQYDKALDARYYKEREKTFKTMNSKPVLRTLYPMEEEASKIYTRKIFRMFQEELVYSQKYFAEKSKVVGDSITYMVCEIKTVKPLYYVDFHLSTKEAECTCHMFEFLGILCRHILTVFIKKKVHKIPYVYILSRWTRDARSEKIQVFSEKLQAVNSTSSTLLFNSVMMHSLELSERASKSEKHHNIAVQGLQELLEELDSLNIDEEPEKNAENQNYVDGNDTGTSQCIFGANITLLDPPTVATKGRPRSLRTKSSLEVSQRRQVTCSRCKKKGHTRRTCKQYKQMRCEVRDDARDYVSSSI